MRRIQVIDSHTEGEPTRVVLTGGPDLEPAPAAVQRRLLARHHDALRRAVVLEPRGHDAVVGAVLLPPIDPQAAAQVVFFNNRGYLGMCVHGTMGVAVTLAHLGRIEEGQHRLETPVGDVGFTLQPDHHVQVENVESYRQAANVALTTRRHGTVHGDIAWGGNWFFLVEDHGLTVDFGQRRELLDCARDVLVSLGDAGVTGADGAEIDHVELFGPARSGGNSRNFVLCPGGEYDRSPCGTGTSAKLACLAADGVLCAGEPWIQESVLGTRFIASFRPGERGIIPRLEGRAFLTAQSELLFENGDPFLAGIRE